MKKLRILLVIVAVVCIGVAVSYPIRYQLALRENNEELQDLSAMRRRVREEQGIDREPIDSGLAYIPNIETQADDAAAPDDGAAVPPVQGDAATEAPAPTEVPATGGTSEGPAEAPAPTEAPATGGTPEGPTEVPAPPEAPASQGLPAVTVPPDVQVPPAVTEAPSGPESTVEAAPAETTGAPGPAETLEPGQAPTPVVGGPTIPDRGEPPEWTTASGGTGSSDETLAPGETQAPVETAVPTPGPTPDILALIINDPEMATPTPSPVPTPTPSPTPVPTPTPDRTIRTGALAYDQRQKVELDPEKMLPELRDIYALNHDLIGWIYIEDTLIDYPVVQTEDSEFYLKHDFYGNSNANGQIILDTNCDPYTPSYNLVISGHRMNSGAMFGRLTQYRDKKYWQAHRLVEFDTLMARKQYVIFAVFNSADYDVDEEGFRYNADIQYKREADQWLEEIRENQLYDTGIDVGFGDEFITLTTCDRSRRRDGRFVVVARRIREGERIE